MSNDHDKVDKVDIVFGALGIMMVNAVPLWGLSWAWCFAVAWNPDPGPPIIPLIVATVLFLEYTGGKLLSKGKVAKGRFVYLGQILIYGAGLSAVVPILLTLWLLLPHLKNLLYIIAHY